ncbi:hypothetical protein DL96DRAFT_1611201 [Flagelloscypha sp. PMI_526]|nr:hypothetical protein DL96DRAFT_1611201 [Flagelloscypha sp. PMI_526]
MTLGSINLPDELLFEITSFLEGPQHILSFLLTCKALHQILLASLYYKVILLGNHHCKTTIQYFLDNRSNATLVRHLTLRPNDHDRDGGKVSLPFENWLVDQVNIMVLDGTFKSLTGFVFNGAEVPREDIWTALRARCPKISEVGMSVGRKIQGLNENSELFKFTDLMSFELRTQPTVKSYTHAGRSKRFANLPPSLTSMLLKHSPNLTSLYLDSSAQTTQLWDLRPIMEGRWPHLKHLRIAALPDSNLIEQNHAILEAFLIAHASTLITLEFAGASYFSSCSSRSLPAVFPGLRSFHGRRAQVEQADLLPCITDVRLTDWFSPGVNFTFLSKLGHLKVLFLCLNLGDQGDPRKSLGILFSGCRALLRFEPFLSAQKSLVVLELIKELGRHPTLYSIGLTCPSTSRFLGFVSGDIISACMTIAHRRKNFAANSQRRGPRFLRELLERLVRRNSGFGRNELFGRRMLDGKRKALGRSGEVVRGRCSTVLTYSGFGVSRF